MAVTLAVTSAWAQDLPAPKDDPARGAAFEAYDAGKMVEALPQLEALAAKYPTDIVIKERWAFSTLLYAATLNDPEQRKKARVRARAIALEAQKLGDNSQLLMSALEVPEDGSEGLFSKTPEVDAAMRSAEANFARGEYDKARDGYIQVLLLEPTNYDAALFVGDVYFRQHVQGSAGEWFARAVQIDPNREAAYRYWADSLLAFGKNTEAWLKFIDAIVAELCRQSAWDGAQKWAHLNKTELHLLRLEDKAQVRRQDDRNINITLDNSAFAKKNDLNGLAWTSYGLTRVLWQGDRFKKEFPNEPKYRRTMKEEVDCLHSMLAVLKEQKHFDKKKAGLPPSLLELIKIDDAGLLEPFVLISRADNDIAQDYPAYRDANREKVRVYLDTFVVPAPSQ